MIFGLIVILAGAVGVMAQRDGIKNIQWTLTYAGGREVTAALAYIEIDDNGKLTGSTGCNRMFGTANVNAQRIEFAGIGSTKMMCKLPDGTVGEPVFLNALERASRFSKSGNTLHIYDKQGRSILRFTRQVKLPPVEEPINRPTLENRKWVLESIKGRQTFVPIEGAFINFDAVKRSVGGNSSCNVFGGRYTVNGSRIKVTNTISTMRACIEDNKMAVEREFLDGLRRSNRYEIADGRLKLYRGRSLLLTLRPESKA